jgi:hypothetical protein
MNLEQAIQEHMSMKIQSSQKERERPEILERQLADIGA